MSERRCHECTLCCKVLPVRELGKAAGVRCVHQRAHGCRIYEARPQSCRTWSCLWLTNEDMLDMPRPDRAHYVIDPSPDYVEAIDEPSGARFRIPVVQIWIDPAHPLAYRDAQLLAWIERRAQRTRQAALIRFDSTRALMLCPPSMSADGQWHEKHGTPTHEHPIAEVLATYRAHS